MLSQLHWSFSSKFQSVFGWLAPAASAVARPRRPLLLLLLPSFPISAFNPVPPSFHLASLPGRLPISNIEMIRSCFVISTTEELLCPPFLLHRRYCFRFWNVWILFPFNLEPLPKTLDPFLAPKPPWMLSASYLFLHECLVCRTNLSRRLYPRNSILTIVINKQIILVNICAQMMKMVLIMMCWHLGVNLGLG